MTLLTDPNRIAELRRQFPTLTHTSWKELAEIKPMPNVDKHHEDLGDIVCATSSDSDFYALRCNERRGMINFSFPYRDADGKINRIFIFEKMKDTYYEHVVSSEKFIPIVSEDSEKGVFSGEWVFQPQKASNKMLWTIFKRFLKIFSPWRRIMSSEPDKPIEIIKPISVKVGHKEEILKRTPARVFTISDMKRFEEKRHNPSFIKMIKNSNTSLEAVTKLVGLGILKAENRADDLRNLLAQYTDYGNDTSNKELSIVQQESVLSRQSQNGQENRRIKVR